MFHFHPLHFLLCHPIFLVTMSFRRHTNIMKVPCFDDKSTRAACVHRRLLPSNTLSSTIYQNGTCLPIRTTLSSTIYQNGTCLPIRTYVQWTKCVSVSQNHQLMEQWDDQWGYPIFPVAMLFQRHTNIMRVLHFDDKLTWAACLQFTCNPYNS